jgi:TolB-like protein
LMSITLALGQSSPVNRLAIFPFQSIGVDEVTTKSAESLLRTEIKKLEKTEVIAENEVNQALGEEICTEIPCAVEIGHNLAADQVVLIKLMTLGEKIIVEFSLIDVLNQKVLLTDQLSSATVEDLDVTMKRLAVSIIRKESVEKTAEIDLITEKETQTPRRRSSRKFTGFSFGYLYPQQGYDDTDRSFTMDFRTGAEINQYSIGMLLAARKGFAMNIFGSYLFSKKDFCPYLGGAFGFHWVSHDEYSYVNGYPEESKKKGDGFELLANGGLLAFHTYNIQILVNLAYSYTLNDFDDQAIVFTIGLLR